MTDTGRPSEPDSTFPWTIELALSGGGLRATAYALGALLYLAHTGLNSKVRNISSVSGGSITNAFVACQCSYEACGIDDFKPIAGSLVRKIATCGLLSRLSTWLYIIVVSVLSLGLAMILIIDLLRYISVVHTSWRMSGLVICVILLIVFLLYFRSWPIDRWMGTTFFGKGAKKITLGSLAQRGVDHVFCATDLGFALPFFFSTAEGGRQFSEIYGRADAPNVRVLTAVRASAAFPPFIPPIRYKTRHLWGVVEGFDMKAVLMLHPVWLTDGGAFNNFGTDWHRLRQNLYFCEGAHQKSVKQSDAVREMYEAHERRYGQVQLIIDAAQTAPPKRLASFYFPIVGWLAYVVRTMDIMYGSTLAARSEGAEMAAISRMNRTPEKWRPNDSKFKPDQDGFDSEGSLDGALKIYVPYSTDLLNIFRRWGVFAFDGNDDALRRSLLWRDQAATDKAALDYLWPEQEVVPTTFRSLGPLKTLKLVVAGYLATREAVYGALGYRPYPVPSKDWFQELLSI